MRFPVLPGTAALVLASAVGFARAQEPLMEPHAAHEALEPLGPGVPVGGPAPPESPPEPGEPGTTLSVADVQALAEIADRSPYEWAGLPYVAGSTDYGVLFGVGSVLTYDPGDVEPYGWRGELGLQASVLETDAGTELAQHYDSLRWDFPGLADGLLRVVFQVLFQRTINAGYYGLGNASGIGLPPGMLERGRRFQYVYQAPAARFNIALRLTDTLDLRLGLHGRYVMPSVYEGSVLAEDVRRVDAAGEPWLRGTTDHAGLRLMAGLIWDTRDDETVPSSGFLHELSLRGDLTLPEAGPSGSGGLFVHLRYYFPVVAPDWLVIAVRVLADLQFGDVPFYDLTRGGSFQPLDMPGGSEGIRGVPSGRYAGRIKVLGSIELRAMLVHFDLFDQPSAFGLVAFSDAGRVWSDYESRPDLDGTGGGLKYGAGGGLHLRWGRSALVRAEIAWSPDAEDASVDFPLGAYVEFAQAF